MVAAALPPQPRPELAQRPQPPPPAGFALCSLSPGGGCGRGGCWFCCLFFISVNDSEGVSRCRRGVFISARSGERQVHPWKAIFFSSHAKKAQPRSPVLPVPKALPALPDSFSTAIAPVAPHSHARVFYYYQPF